MPWPAAPSLCLRAPYDIAGDLHEKRKRSDEAIQGSALNIQIDPANVRPSDTGAVQFRRRLSSFGVKR
jgi:hypothetical protein